MRNRTRRKQRKRRVGYLPTSVEHHFLMVVKLYTCYLLCLSHSRVTVQSAYGYWWYGAYSAPGHY